jgi:hypothetical protein
VLRCPSSRCRSGGKRQRPSRGFTPKERANFNLEDINTPEAIEEGNLIVDLAEGSNHSFRTFNYAYAGSTTLTMSTLLHRALRAPLSWRTLFGGDELLAEEKARSNGKRRGPHLSRAL